MEERHLSALNNAFASYSDIEIMSSPPSNPLQFEEAHMYQARRIGQGTVYDREDNVFLVVENIGRFCFVSGWMGQTCDFLSFLEWIRNWKCAIHGRVILVLCLFCIPFCFSPLIFGEFVCIQCIEIWVFYPIEHFGFNEN